MCGHIESKMRNNSIIYKRIESETADLQPPSKSKFKKYRFFTHDYIKRFTWFTQQLKSATETVWWLIWNFEKYNKILGCLSWN